LDIRITIWKKPISHHIIGIFMMVKTDLFRVLIADAHPIIRRRLALGLETCEHLCLVGEAVSSATAIQMCSEVKPELVLMGLMMPDMDGLETTRAIRRAHPEIQVLILTSLRDQKINEIALQAGAAGCLYKFVEIETLVQKICRMGCRNCSCKGE
jgi:DNA-binding NarL/FixJ family response regulator